MPTPTFQCLTLEQFERLLGKFHFSRKVDAVHMHHTWRPRHADFRGHSSIVAMWRHHTQVNGWSDIAQHLTIDPDGLLWLGRNWNLPPASAAGHNGNRAFGPFMFEMVGDFDLHRDPFAGKQKDSALTVTALLQQRFNLPPGSLRFHNSMSAKSCPGSAIDYEDTLRELEALRGDLATAAPRSPLPFPAEEDRAIADAIRSLGRVTDNAGERGDAEPSHDEGEESHSHVDAAVTAPSRKTALSAERGRGSGLDATTLASMRPHLVNLRSGRLSAEGETTSTTGDIDAIFEEHLPRAVSEARPGEKLRLLFFAHGGLVSEASGLQVAHKHLDWWRRNQVYPVYFVWETGFFETMGQLLGRAREASRGVTRDLADHTTDPIIEAAARAFQGPRIWGGMKWSAERAVDAPTPADPAGGGAWYVAAKLKAFCDKYGAEVELHAVGHSAGSIFHSHFIPLASRLKVPPFKSVHFMAPAVRVDTFKQQLLALVGPSGPIEHLTVYTMDRDHERDDDCARAYRKSLLYLIYYGLEDARKTPILGLEESLRGDPGLKQLFGLGAPAGAADIVWSPTAFDSGRSASTATSHGGFDDDAPTMNSIARRVLGRPDAGEIEPYPASRTMAREWIDEVDWPPGDLMPPQPGTTDNGFWQPKPITTSDGWAPALPFTPPNAQPKGQPEAGSGRRLALCVGINAYPVEEHRLGGCVNDAQNWAATLSSLGFETRLLLDGDATRASIDTELKRLVSESRSGDVIVFQYAGHGTRVPDLDGDEGDDYDEALCPVDFASGSLFIDDDISEVFARIPEGVNMTCFMDCCHSGTNTRFAVGLSSDERARPPGTRSRFVVATPAVIEAHRRFRADFSARGRSVGSGGERRMRDVKFSACLDHQVALESGGNGDFTRRATKVLARGVEGMTHGEFLRRVLAEFGARARQEPMLDCADTARECLLLQPFAVAAGNGARPPSSPREAPGADLLQAVNVLAQAVQTLSAR